MRQADEPVPVLFFNAGSEDKEAYFQLRESGIRCEYLSSPEQDRPVLLVRGRTFVGAERIKEFVKTRQSNSAPGPTTGEARLAEGDRRVMRL